jgi:hypothetical protein
MLGAVPILRNPDNQLCQRRQIDLNACAIRIDGDTRDQAKERIGPCSFGEQIPGAVSTTKCNSGITEGSGWLG